MNEFPKENVLNMKFRYTDTEMKVLKNFSTINPNMVVFHDKFAVIDGPNKSVVGSYKFKTPYEYDSFGIFQMDELLSIVSQVKEHELEVNEKHVSIFDKSVDSETKYNLTPQTLLPNIDTDTLMNRFDEQEANLEFVFTAEKLNSIKKISQILKCERLFFESLKGKIRIIAAQKSLLQSVNPHEIIINSDDITTNNLGDDIVFINVDEFRLLEGDYDVRLCKSGISHWHNKFVDVDYYIGLSTDKEL